MKWAQSVAAVITNLITELFRRSHWSQLVPRSSVSLRNGATKAGILFAECRLSYSYIIDFYWFRIKPGQIVHFWNGQTYSEIHTSCCGRCWKGTFDISAARPTKSPPLAFIRRAVWGSGPLQPLAISLHALWWRNLPAWKRHKIALRFFFLLFFFSSPACSVQTISHFNWQQRYRDSRTVIVIGSNENVHINGNDVLRYFNFVWCVIETRHSSARGWGGGVI